MCCDESNLLFQFRLMFIEEAYVDKSDNSTAVIKG